MKFKNPSEYSQQERTYFQYIEKKSLEIKDKYPGIDYISMLKHIHQKHLPSHLKHRDKKSPAYKKWVDCIHERKHILDYINNNY